MSSEIKGKIEIKDKYIIKKIRGKERVSMWSVPFGFLSQVYGVPAT